MLLSPPSLDNVIALTLKMTVTKQPAASFGVQMRLSPLSTFKELLRWSRTVICVAPLVGSQLQALFAIAEEIVDIVEARVHSA